MKATCNNSTPFMIFFLFTLSFGASYLNIEKYQPSNKYKNYCHGEDSFAASYNSSDIESYYDFKTFYFDNLTSNFGHNCKNSCGYVSIGMLLSYYDSYLNDDIIPEVYDVISNGSSSNMAERRNSPGIYNDIINYSGIHICELFDGETYLQQMNSFSPYSLHSKLISISNILGYYNSSSNTACCNSTLPRIESVLRYYLEEIGYTDNIDYTISKMGIDGEIENHFEIKNFVIQKIQSGKPVILGALNPFSLTGHFAVAYDYNQDTGDIYCNMGLDESSTHLRMEDLGYILYDTALSIDFNFNHTCNDNFAVKTLINDTEVTNYYCYHDCRISTYVNGNRHEYDDHYVEYNSNYHKAYCVCGAVEIKPHVVQSGTQYILHGHSYANCMYCGALLDLGSSIIPIIHPLYFSNNLDWTCQQFVNMYSIEGSADVCLKEVGYEIQN